MQYDVRNTILAFYRLPLKITSVTLVFNIFFNPLGLRARVLRVRELRAIGLRA